ncbi:MAG: redoxin domain-containing protein, partial [Deltaproteobacteria bacterium]|nr:redoxin domain-containing protein [Deltaproteobacteria bacterium]
MLVRFVQVLGLAALSLSVTLAASPAFAQRPSVGEPAPSFGLPVANVPGVQRYSLEEDILESSAGLNVLSFFSMSCEPCKRELGYFNQLVA